MPALPELRHRQAAVGGVEVHRQPQSQQPRTAGSNIAVTGKIEVQLEGIAQNDTPRRRRRQSGQIAPAVIDQHAQIVRQQHLLASPRPRAYSPAAVSLGWGDASRSWGKKFCGFRMGPEDTVGKKKL